MFRKDSILYEVNAISKLISFLIFVFSLMILKSPAFLVLLSIVFLALTYSFQWVSKFAIAGVLFSIVSSIYMPFLKIAKLITILVYILIIKKITNSQELRYVLEVTLYKFQSKKITFHILYFMYFFKYLKKNIKLPQNGLLLFEIMVL